LEDLPSELQAMVEVVAVAVELLHDRGYGGIEPPSFGEEIDLGPESLFEVLHLPFREDPRLDVSEERHELRLVPVDLLHTLHLKSHRHVYALEEGLALHLPVEHDLDGVVE
jgi:hypothetical protein